MRIGIALHCPSVHFWELGAVNLLFFLIKLCRVKSCYFCDHFPVTISLADDDVPILNGA